MRTAGSKRREYTGSQSCDVRGQSPRSSCAAPRWPDRPVEGDGRCRRMARHAGMRSAQKNSNRSAFTQSPRDRPAGLALCPKALLSACMSRCTSTNSRLKPMFSDNNSHAAQGLRNFPIVGRAVTEAATAAKLIDGRGAARPPNKNLTLSRSEPESGCAAKGEESVQASSQHPFPPPTKSSPIGLGGLARSLSWGPIWLDCPF